MRPAKVTTQVAHSALDLPDPAVKVAGIEKMSTFPHRCHAQFRWSHGEPAVDGRSVTILRRPLPRRSARGWRRRRSAAAGMAAAERGAANRLREAGAGARVAGGRRVSCERRVIQGARRRLRVVPGQADTAAEGVGLSGRDWRRMRSAVLPAVAVPLLIIQANSECVWCGLGSAAVTQARFATIGRGPRSCRIGLSGRQPDGLGPDSITLPGKRMRLLLPHGVGPPSLPCPHGRGPPANSDLSSQRRARRA